MIAEQLPSVFFLIFAAISLVGALGVVVARTVFVSALWLILSFIGVACLYVMLGAGFLAAIQVLIYVGAISVLILFAVMLTHNVMDAGERPNKQWVLGTIAGLTLLGFLTTLGYVTAWPLSNGEVVPGDGVTLSAEAAATVPGAVRVGSEIMLPGTVAQIGRALMTEHLLAFELISMILLVALVGAIVIARE